jgi:hypothetical protein
MIDTASGGNVMNNHRRTLVWWQPDGLCICLPHLWVLMTVWRTGVRDVAHHDPQCSAVIREVAV